MNIGYERLDSIMGALKKGTADARAQKAAYQMFVKLSRVVKACNVQLDEMIRDQYVRKVKRVR